MPNGRIFLLSPANAGGRRAKLLLRSGASFELARRFQSEGATLGEVFAFVSGLYFRGKLVYSTRFSHPPHGMPGSLVITVDRGLCPPETVITAAEFEAMSAEPIDLSNAAYREPLVRDARLLAAAGCEVVLLGSIATRKYMLPLTQLIGNNL